jgi:predicted membrane channel-forming protein YqfA (hemolysin III family)
MVAIWLFLAVATVFSLSLFEEFNSTDARRYVGFAVMGVAFVKVRFIGLDFMELRRAPAPLRLAFEAWLLVIAGTLMTMYSRT